MTASKTLSRAALCLLAAFTLGWGTIGSCTCGSSGHYHPVFAVSTYPPLPDATQGADYSAVLEARNGSPPYSWSVSAGALPPGLTLDPGTGAISGTPTVSGTAHFTARATDSDSGTASAALTLVVNPPPALANASLPDGVAGIDYAANLVAAGGTPPFTWSLASGSLPAGLALDGPLGRIAGAPSAAGVSSFTVRVTEKWGATSDAGLTLTVQVDPGTFPHLVVADDGASPGIHIWNDADAIAADRASDAVLGGTAPYGVLRLALHANRLIAVTRDPAAGLAVWDGATALAGGATPAATVPSSQLSLGTLTDVFDLSVDLRGNLWACANEIRLFLDAGLMDSSATCRARFVRNSSVIFHSAVYDATGDRLVGGSRASDEICTWHAPASHTGTVYADGSSLGRIAPRAMALAGDRLYVGTLSPGTGEGFVEIREDIVPGWPETGVYALGAASGLGPVVHLEVRGDVLVATVNGTECKVNLYANAGTISGDVAPLASATDAALVNPRKSHLAKDGSLYVLVDDGILVFRNATTAPAFACKIMTGLSGPSDFLLIE